MEAGYKIHFHVWTARTLKRLLADLQTRFGLPFQVESIKTDRRQGETILVLRRS